MTRTKEREQGKDRMPQAWRIVGWAGVGVTGLVFAAGAYALLVVIGR